MAGIDLSAKVVVPWVVICGQGRHPSTQLSGSVEQEARYVVAWNVRPAGHASRRGIVLGITVEGSKSTSQLWKSGGHVDMVECSNRFHGAGSHNWRMPGFVEEQEISAFSPSWTLLEPGKQSRCAGRRASGV
jgi:hypothetical protein